MPSKHGPTEFEQLEALGALFQERSVTRAADRLGRSQSAVSKQLKRLREIFDDELFTYVDREMSPTPLASSLMPDVLDVLARWEALMSHAPFDPVAVERRFVVSTTDEVQGRLLPELLETLRDGSPRSSLMFTPLRADYSRAHLESGNVDLVISVNWSAPESLVQRHLFRDEFTCVMRKGHALSKKRLTIQEYAKAEHLLVAPLGQKLGVADEALGEHELTRNIALYLPNFLEAADVLERSNLVALLPKRVAKTFKGRCALVQRRPPLTLRPIDYYAFWHRRYDRDPEHRMLRDAVMRVASSS